MGFWSALASRALDVLAPPTCAACDAPIASDGTFCDACRPADDHEKSSSVIEAPLIVAGSYAEPLSTAIVRFKYGGRPELARPLARLLTPLLRERSLAPGAIFVPVPLHPKRLAERGYNQAGLLAQELARATGRAFRPRLLARTRDMEHQVGKSRVARLENAIGSFSLRQASPSPVVLVDDVITTGSTVRACAHALTRGGVRLVMVVALAEARDQGPGRSHEDEAARQ